MNYVCKVLTPDFKKLVDLFIEERTEQVIGIAKEFKKIDLMSGLLAIWNRPSDLSTETILIYESLGLYPAQFTEVTLKSAETGYQNKARVIWNDEVQKIDEIDEIISYKMENDVNDN